MLFAFFFAYTYAFFFGGIWVHDDYYNDILGRNYSAGDVMICFFGIIFGLFASGVAAPNHKAINDGKAAAKLTFEIIDRTPEIRLDEGKKIDPNGDIVFNNVNFYYPSKPD